MDTMPQPVLRDGETRVDHAGPKAPVQGPPTVGMVLLAPLSYDQLRCLIARLEVTIADVITLRPAEEYGSERWAELDALYDETRSVLDEAYRSSPAAIAADYERDMARIGGSR